MRKTSELLFLLSISLLLFACKKLENPIEPYQLPPNQGYEIAIGTEANEWAQSLNELNGNLFILASKVDSGSSNSNIQLIEVNVRGAVLNEYNYGSNHAEEASKIIKTSDNNLLLLGWTKNTSTTAKNIWLSKVNSSGQVIWEKTYGGDQDDFANDIIELQNGNYLITGATTSYGEGSSDIYLLWIDSEGNVIQEKTHGAVDQDGGTQSIELANNDLVTYGYTWNYGAVSRDYYLLKMNANGDSLWSKRYGGADYEETQAFAMTNNGEFVLNGHSASTDPIHNMLGVKTDANGNVIWQKDFGGPAHDGGMAFLINSRNEYVFVARSMSFEANQNVFITITDSQGNIIKDLFIGESSEDMANEIIEFEGYYYLVGRTTSYSSGDADVYLVRLAIN